MSRDDLSTSGDPTVIRRLERRLDILTAALTMFLLERLTAEQLDLVARRAAAEFRRAEMTRERALHLIGGAVTNQRLHQFERGLRLADDEMDAVRGARERIARVILDAYATGAAAGSPAGNVPPRVAPDGPCASGAGRPDGA